MTQIHPQQIIVFVLLQQRIHECLLSRCRALMARVLHMKLRVPGRIRPQDLLQNRYDSPEEVV